jgi:hypothetical protein
MTAPITADDDDTENCTTRTNWSLILDEQITFCKNIDGVEITIGEEPSYQNGATQGDELEKSNL